MAGRVKGSAELARNLDAISNRLGNALRLSAAAGGLVVCRHAKENLKANGTWETGSLARSVHVGGHEDLTPDFNPAGDASAYNRTYSPVQQPQVEPMRATVYAGTNLEYGPYIETGTSRAAAHPFLQPAGENHLDEIATDVARVLRREAML